MNKVLFFFQGVRRIVGNSGFQIVATMNPGGDFGKRELSPALRNRLVEIWCPSIASRQDIIALIESHLGQEITYQIHEVNNKYLVLSY